MLIRPEMGKDHAAIRQVVVSAFGRENEARLIDAVRRSPHFLPALSLVAVDDERVIGHILFSAIGIRTAQEVVPALALAPMAVQPDFQRQGVGGALVRQGLAECRRRGHRIVIVVGHPRYYPRFGFAPARARGLEAPFPVRDAAFMALELVPGALTGIRGTVEYPEAFNGV